MLLFFCDLIKKAKKKEEKEIFVNVFFASYLRFKNKTNML